MKLTKLHVRFYKAFNFNYMRKYRRSADQQPWELMDDGSWYPFVTVSLDDGITTVVGANESGKTQVLDAIEIALTGNGVLRTDFCRYSRFFLVDKVKRKPDFGATFSDLSDDQAEEVGKACGRDAALRVAQFTLIRGGNGSNAIYVRDGLEWTTYELNAKSLKQVDAQLPHPFRLNPKIPLPDAVPLDFLSGGTSAAASKSAISSRAARIGLMSRIAALPAKLIESVEAVTNNAAKVAEVFVPVANANDEDAEAKFRLAEDLLINITGVDREHFADLLQTISDGRDGYVDGVEELINRSLAARLNFRRWWTQDSSFQLRVTIRESDIAFLVRDRTGTHYSFGERSGGLSYFLSYFVQYLSHRPVIGRDEILLMDEPDTYLSSQGQKDLLRIFDAFADPEDGSTGCQVVYVTHSPFLVDKNHAERIRVIEKGDGDEGTRVVGDVSRNHYEPLRSSFGALVGETTFMGNCNLMVEGISDQILIAGLSRRLRRLGLPKTDYLDLNDVTIVPAGGAPHIPYLVYLARGRDVEKPAVIVLLDAGEAGNDARAAIKRGGAYKRALIRDELVLQLGDDRLSVESARGDGAHDIEDLIPIEVAVRAVERYATEFLGLDVAGVTLDPSKMDLTNGVFAGVVALLNAELTEPSKVEKLGFARAVMDQLKLYDSDPTQLPAAAVECLEANFQALCRVLGAMQRTAVREHDEVKLSDRIARIRNGFLEDHDTTVTKVDVQVLFEELQHALDSSSEAEDIRSELRRLSTVHELEVDAASEVENFEALRNDLAELQYRGRYQSQEASAGDIAAETTVVSPGVGPSE